MRPTVSEQLLGSCRLLEEVVAPDVAGAAAEQVLFEVVRNLRMIEGSWSRILPFLLWDNRATLGALATAQEVLPEELSGRVARAQEDAEPQPWDVEAVAARNDHLRELLSDVITVLDSGAGDQEARVYRMIREHLMTRAKQYPMRTVPQLSRSTGEGNQ